MENPVQVWEKQLNTMEFNTQLKWGLSYLAFPCCQRSSQSLKSAQNKAVLSLHVATHVAAVVEESPDNLSLSQGWGKGTPFHFFLFPSSVSQ